MSKNKDLKITKKELETIQDKVKAINSLQMNIGGLEVQKTQAIQMLNAAQAELGVINGELEKKYGNVSVNIETGIINRNGSPDKKN
jgi:allophanate hydrolase subunit 1